MDKVFDATGTLYICSTLTTLIIVLTLTVRKLPAFVCNILQATWLERVPVLISWQELPDLSPLTFHPKARSPSSAYWLGYFLPFFRAWGYIVGMSLMKPFQCKSKSPRSCGPVCRIGLLSAVCRFEDYFGSSNNRERMKEPSACIVRMFIFAWNRMICKDVSTTQQSWITRLTFSFLQNKRSVLIEKILLFWKKRMRSTLFLLYVLPITRTHCFFLSKIVSTIQNYRMLLYLLCTSLSSTTWSLSFFPNKCSSLIVKFPLFRIREWVLLFSCFASYHWLGATVSSQPSAQPSHPSKTLTGTRLQRTLGEMAYFLVILNNIDVHVFTNLVDTLIWSGLSPRSSTPPPPV